jgi:putative hemolysin
MKSIPWATTLAGPRNSFSAADSLRIRDCSYTARIANSQSEVESALRLRYKVFNLELGNSAGSFDDGQFDFDTFDLRCRHLIVVSNETGETVGTYRLNSIETAHTSRGFYSANEFTIEDLPSDVLNNGIEIGRACIAREHRSTRVLFLLWRALLGYLEKSRKRYFFGCCSVFTDDPAVGRRAYRQLARDGQIHDRFSVFPCNNGISLLEEDDDVDDVELPPLFNMYLKLGARVCGPPVIDRAFGTIDFFVVFDVRSMTEKYRRMFKVA